MVEKPTLTNQQQDVLNKLIAGLTIKQICVATQRSKWAIYQAIRILRQKGYTTEAIQRLYNNQGVVTHPTQLIKGKWRLHSCQFVINILSRGIRHKAFIGKQDRVETHLIKFHDNKIEVYQADGNIYPASLYHNDLNKLQSLAGDYWFSLFYKLQKLYDITIVQEGKPSVKEAKCHIADTDNPASKDIILNYGNGLYLYDLDGKAFMIFDMSHKEPEVEYIKAQENWADASKINPFFVDLKHNEFYLPSQTKQMLDYQLDYLNKFGKEYELHREVLIKIGKAVENLGIVTSKLRHDLKTKQKTLRDY